MKNRKVLLVVESTSRAMDRAFLVMTKRPKTNKNIEIISFPDFAILSRVITGARLKLLSNIKLMKPHSIQELARMVKRDFINAYQDIQLLAEIGLIELKESDPRKSAEPIAKYSEIILAA